jgi:hypothetical protein
VSSPKGGFPGPLSPDTSPGCYRRHILDRNHEKKKIDLCKDAVDDFINANSTDEACISLIPKIQIDYGFSINFTKNARNTFPFLEHITDDLQQWQKRIIDLYFSYWAEENLIEEAVWNLMLLFYEYDFSKDKLILQKESDGKLVPIPLKDFDKNFNKIEKKIINSCPDNTLVEPWKNSLQGFELSDHISKMRIFAKLISKAGDDISKKQEKEIRSFLGNKLLLAHSKIFYKQVVIKMIINRAINRVRLDRYGPFSYLINSYEKSLGPSISILTDGNLKFKDPTIREEYFTQYYKPPKEQDENRDYFGVGARNLNAYMSAINHFFVEFLKPFNNISRFHHCKNCNKYFISQTKRKAIFCSKKCRQDWHNKVRIKSGEHAKYKRKKRLEGAKESYYG